MAVTTTDNPTAPPLPLPDADIELGPHTTVIQPSSGWAALNLRDVWLYRDLLLTLAARDVKLRYRQTALGAIWVLLQPLLAAGIFSFVFGKVGHFPSDGVPYFLFSYAGLLGWNAFSSTLTKASGCLVGNANLVSKIYFPRLVLPLSTLFSTLIDFAVALAMMAVLMVAYHVTPHLGLLLLPVWLLLILMLAVGFGLIAAALTVSYRDVQYVLPVLTQFALYASPVAYAVSAVPAHLRAFYFLNPLAPCWKPSAGPCSARATSTPAPCSTPPPSSSSPSSAAPSPSAPWKGSSPMSSEATDTRPPDIPQDWWDEFEAAARRPLAQRMRYAFIKTYKPVLDDESYRSFETMEDYRQWCEASLLDWLGYGRV